MSRSPAARVRVPDPGGRLQDWTPTRRPVLAPAVAGFASRVAFAAAHVVADPLADNTPGAPAVVDWEATLGVRDQLWSLGFGVAEAMDTAQRGMGLDWPATAELIQRSSARAAAVGGRIAAGVGTDHLPPGPHPIDAVLGAYADQLEVTEQAGAQPILMASRALAASAPSAEDYAKVYGRLLEQTSGPVILHWLGEVFDPLLAGYWGSLDLDDATETVLALVADHADRIEGIKVSLLDADREVALRRRLPAGVRLFTGDDFNYPQLIAGDGVGDHPHSDALLGVFAAIAPAASAALQALDAEDRGGYHALLTPTVPLARHLFSAPTYYYKTGIAFLSWLNGHQVSPAMVGGLHAGRSLPHLVRAAQLADTAGVLTDPDLAVHRLRQLLAVHGIDQP
jgi:hypothetical protein